MRYPSILVLFISYKCNARCIMCSAWNKQAGNTEIKEQDIEGIFADGRLSRSVKVVNITGGEPTLHADLLGIIRSLTDNCRGLKRIDLSTNGINTAEVIDKIEQILAYLLPKEINFTVSVSIDGSGDIHDQVRQTPGAFKEINNTIDELKELMRLYPAFRVGINTTITRQNYSNLSDVLEYSRSKGIGINFTLSAISEIGVESLPHSAKFSLEDGQKERVAIFIENLARENQINSQYAGFMLHWLKRGERLGRCAFRTGDSVLCEPDGSIYACGNFKEFKIGNPLNQDKLSHNRGFRKLYNYRCASCNSNCYLD